MLEDYLEEHLRYGYLHEYYLLEDVGSKEG